MRGRINLNTAFVASYSASAEDGWTEVWENGRSACCDSSIEGRVGDEWCVECQREVRR